MVPRNRDIAAFLRFVVTEWSWKWVEAPGTPLVLDYSCKRLVGQSGGQAAGAHEAVLAVVEPETEAPTCMPFASYDYESLGGGEPQYIGPTVHTQEKSYQGTRYILTCFY